MCTTCNNTNLRVPLAARRLTINFERNSQIVTLSKTDVSATFTSTFAIYDTLMKRQHARKDNSNIMCEKVKGRALVFNLCGYD